MTKWDYCTVNDPALKGEVCASAAAHRESATQTLTRQILTSVLGVAAHSTVRASR